MLARAADQVTHNFHQVIMPCWHTTALLPMPTSHVSCTVSRCSLRVHRRAGRPGCWIAVVKREGHIKQVCQEVTACSPQGAIPQPHSTRRTAWMLSGDGGALHWRERGRDTI